jgi:hypothetical protein
MFQKMLVKGLLSEERSALQSVLEFLSEFIAADPRRVHDWNTTIVTSIGGDLCGALVSGIATRHPRSLYPSLAEPLFRLVTRHPSLARQWLIAAVGHAVPPARVKDVDQNAVVNQMMMTRHLRKFKEVVRSFGSKCRGYENSVIL